MASDGDDDANTMLDMEYEDISEAASRAQFQMIDNKAKNFINKLLTKTQKTMVEKKKKANRKVMRGQTHYRFPSIDKLEQY